LIFFSQFDPSVLAPYPWVFKLQTLSTTINGLILKIGRLKTNLWRGPITQFRVSLGMPPGGNPFFEGQHSPQRVLALFSPLMGAPQPDWPPQSLVTGFAFYDRADHRQGLDLKLARFLESGPPPLVFTLGSSAVHVGRLFYRESLAAIRRLGCRAVLLVGENAIEEPLPPGTVAFPYAPYSQLLPRAALTVHQGGIGTCAQALAAGRPMLLVPFAFDQPDNAARLQRLGVARVIPRQRYSGARAAAEIERLLSDPTYAANATLVARRLAEENGVRAACDAIENHPL
jgi:UDP:flavonoid glycosyltransferase YjiC (YdhE family)